MMFLNCFLKPLDTSKKVSIFNGKLYTSSKQNEFNKFCNFNVMYLKYDPASHAGSRRFKSYSAHRPFVNIVPSDGEVYFLEVSLTSSAIICLTLSDSPSQYLVISSPSR